jgi:hypothetical protein
MEYVRSVGRSPYPQASVLLGVQHGRRRADRHDVDPIELFCLMLQAGLDTAYQRFDLGTMQAIVDVNAGDNPYPARPDEAGQELANAGSHRDT